MPYLKLEDRIAIDGELQNILGRGIHTSGELNYIITKMALNYLDTKERDTKESEGRPLRYDDFNAVMGAFESAKQEFYRRAVVPYEEQKISQNGDVYPDGDGER